MDRFVVVNRETVDIHSLLAQLENLSAEIEGGRESYWKATFPRPDGADYAIIAFVYADGGADISPKRYRSGDGEYFCSIVFEEDDFSTAQALQNSFLETLVLLLDNPTRIVQVKSLLFMNFACAYFSDGEWWFAGGGAGFRLGNFEFPKIDGKEKEYRSPPVRA